MSSTPMVDARADWRVVGDLLPLLACDSEREGWTQAVEIAHHLFGGDLAITIEFVHDDRAVFRSSVGLELPIGGDQTFPCAPDSQAAFVARSGAPCRSDDIALDDRFVASALLTSVGVRSSLTSAFALANGRSVLIGVHSRSPALFDHDDETAFGEFTEFVGTAMRSIRRRAVLERGAHFDPLTDLANRPTIIEFLGEQIAVGRSEVTSMLIDLDGFKTVNDDHGHRTGDIVLRTVAARIERCLSLGDRLGRLGGDEFLLVTDTPDVGLLTERILGHIEEAILVEGRLVQVSASIGVARRRSDDDATSMIERADRLMYSAKSVGRGTMRSDVRVGQGRATTRRDDPGRVSSSLALVDDAIARLRIAVQPIVNAGCHTVRGVEVLSRGPLDHPLEFPDRLFATAATFGRLGELELASKVLAFEAVVPDDLDLYVNLEPALLCDEAWLARLTAAWVRSNSTRPVVAELTEREVLRSPGSLIRAVEACRELGWKIALDDLGSRSESLAALRWIRPDVVKLDMSLIENDNPAHAAHIVAAIAA